MCACVCACECQSIVCLSVCPLTQVTNHVGGDQCYQERVTDQLVRCIPQLAVAAGRDSLWKPLNHHLFLKTRDSKPEVRDCRQVKEVVKVVVVVVVCCCLLLLFFVVVVVVVVQVRVAVLKIAHEMYSKLGEECATLLPESIPFLAELMEGE